jgi:hypothetical protein
MSGYVYIIVGSVFTFGILGLMILGIRFPMDGLAAGLGILVIILGGLVNGNAKTTRRS